MTIKWMSVVLLLTACTEQAPTASEVHQFSTTCVSTPILAPGGGDDDSGPSGGFVNQCPLPDSASAVDPGTVPNVADPTLAMTSVYAGRVASCAAQDGVIRCCTPNTWGSRQGACCSLDPLEGVVLCGDSFDIIATLQFLD